MDAVTPSQPVGTAPARKDTHFGITGLVLALLALAAAALSPWAVSALEAETALVDEVAAEIAGRIKDRQTANFKGEAYVAPPLEERGVKWSTWYPDGVVGVGVLAIAIGVIGAVARHDMRLNASTNADEAAEKRVGIFALCHRRNNQVATPA